MDLSLRLSINGNRRQRRPLKDNFYTFAVLGSVLCSLVFNCLVCIVFVKRHITNLKEHCFFWSTRIWAPRWSPVKERGTSPSSPSPSSPPPPATATWRSSAPSSPPWSPVSPPHPACPPASQPFPMDMKYMITFKHFPNSQLTSRKLIGLLICGLSTLRNHSWGSIKHLPSYLQLLVPQLKGIGGRNEHLLTASHPCPP